MTKLQEAIETVTKDILQRVKNAKLDTQWVRDLEAKGLSDTEIINCGWCVDWAEELQEALSKTMPELGAYAAHIDLITGNDDLFGHCVLVVGSTYYDSECLTGTSDINQLPFVKRQQKYAKDSKHN